MPGRPWLKTGIPKDASVTSPKIATGQTQSPFNKTASSVVVGLSGVFGATTTLLPDTGYLGIDIKEISYVLGGSFSSDNVTVTVTATFTDNTTATYTPSVFTTTGTTLKYVQDFTSLITDNKNIKSLGVKAKTDQASTSVTLNVQVVGNNIV